MINNKAVFPQRISLLLVDGITGMSATNFSLENSQLTFSQPTFINIKTTFRQHKEHNIVL